MERNIKDKVLNKKNMVMQSAEKEHTNSYLSKDEFIKKIKENNFNINKEKFDDRELQSVSNKISYSKPSRRINRNSYSRSSYRSNYNRSSTLNQEKSYFNIFSSLVLVSLVLFIRFVDLPILNKFENTLNQTISEVRDIDEFVSILDFTFNSKTIDDLENIETVQPVDNIQDNSIENLKTMSNFEIEEGLFSGKK